MKRIAAIHDISCFGKCSLTVALPIISAAGIEASVIPTAVLSTHTGGFTGYTFRDLTEDIKPIIKHWESLDLQFDGFYTGYLGSFEQIDIICDIFDLYSKKPNRPLFLVDPVMADNGSLYAHFDKNFPQEMLKLVKLADVVVPNMTEATLLLGQEYKEGPYTEAYVKQLLASLAALGPKQVVLTGVCFDDKELGAASYDAATGKIAYAMAPRIEGYYHGTGDVFGSALLSGLMNGLSIDKAATVAVNFTVDAIKRTARDKTEIRFGVNFEEGLSGLKSQIGGQA